MPLPENDLSGLNVLAREADIGAALQTGWQDDVAVILYAYILLHECCVHASRHRRAGKHTHGFAGSGRNGSGGPRLNATCNRKGFAITRRYSGAVEGVAIHS